ncbi:hypothetical protein [Actinokineospora sp. NPDC004072]
MNTTAPHTLASRVRMLAWLTTLTRLHETAYPVTRNWVFSCAEDAVLTLGRWSTPAPLPRNRAHGTPRRCYANASHYRAAHGGYYAEGYALTHAGTVHPHAWVVDPDGTTHDPTWPDGTAAAYAGIVFANDFLADRDLTDSRTCLLHEAWTNNYHDLRNGLPHDATIPIGAPIHPPTPPHPRPEPPHHCR